MYRRITSMGAPPVVSRQKLRDQKYSFQSFCRMRGYSCLSRRLDALLYALVNYRHLRGGGLRLPSGTSAAWCRSRLSSLPCLAAWRGGVCVGVVDCTLRARIMFGRDRIAWY